MINSIRRSAAAAAVLVLLLIVCEMSHAVESPTSAGPVSRVDTPIFRIPKTARAPEIDGVMAEGEWEDASALSAFWYDYIAGHFYFLAPIQTQLQLYAMYDDENLYLSYVSPVYPEGSWLKARGRFPNVLHHPLYGILWDDHIELELRPYHDAARGFQLGLFKWVVNPIDVMVDYHWSTTRGSEFTWNSRARFRSSVTATKWILEAEVPLAEMAYGLYDGLDADGNKIVQIPPPDGTAYRTWFARAIGGNGAFFNAFDAHQWNTTKTMMVFDSRAVAFQVNELGPIMDDIVDLHITVKNHNNRSEAMRLGFFVENADGTIYSSYEDDSLSNGLLELIPGEVRRLRLRKPFPGITERGNTLWFDVRTAGNPAKPIFLTRLIDFHSQDKQNWRGGELSFKEARIDVIEKLRPPRIDFDVWFEIWPYTNRLAAVIDRGIHGASEESKTATEARLGVIDMATGDEVANHIEPLAGNFAIAEFDLPELQNDREYQLSVLLFDENRRIVGEHTSENFNKWGFPWWMLEIRHPAPGQVLTPVEEWFGNEIGLNDVVWEPFTPLELTDTGFEGLKHRFDVDATALPAQLYIKPHHRALPLEYRTGDALPTDDELVEIGRGPQLRGPFRLEAVIDGVRHTSRAIEPAKLVRQWQSELEYQSKVRVGPIDVDLKVQYDCDGSIHATLDYGTEGPQVVESFELLADIRGPVDKVASGIGGGGGMTGADIWECALPPYEGVVWDSTTVEVPLYYSQFVPWVFFGSGDRGFSWYADSDRGWGLDKYSSSMNLERNADGELTWRILFVNHPFDVHGRRNIEFHILTHPAKPKPDNYRTIAWNYHGSWMTTGYGVEAVDLSEEYLKAQWHNAADAPRNIPHEEAETWPNDAPPWKRYCRWRQTGMTDAHKISVHTDRVFEERAAYLLERQIRVGRRSGYWWDESWPVGFATSNNIAGGYAYRRDPDTVEEDELPWQRGFTTSHQRRLHKRLARVFAENKVPQRQYHWSNASANFYESFAWDSLLVEECGSEHRSYETDVATQFPMSLYRFMCHPFTGLVTRLVAGVPVTSPGDDKRPDRQLLGLALLHDIGFVPDGPHGKYQHVDQALRLIDILNEFGYFDDKATEFIPYWRNQQIARYGTGRTRHAPSVALNVREPNEQLYVSVYRKAIEIDGRRGYKAIIVLFNGYREDVTADLAILQPSRIFGGPNTLTRSDVFGKYSDEYGELGAMIAQWSRGDDNVPVLLDLENNSVVEQAADDDGELYGSVHVPWHNYRILYGHFLAE